MNDENDNDRVSELFSSLVEATKISQFLTTDDYSFYKLAHPDVGERLSKTGDKLLGLCNRLLGHTALPGANALQFENIDEVMDDFYPVVEIVDHLLEKADVCMDEVTGRNKQNAPNNFGIVAAIDTPTPRVQKNTNIIRPQLKFHDKIDNSNNTPYIRRITHKPNAKRPLDYGLPGSDQLSSEMAQHVKSLGITDASSSFYSLPHPYEYEIKNIDYPADTFEFIDEQMYGSLDDTPLHYIDKLEDFEMMLKKLEGQSHIAIDIEHHDYRSFIGFVCLIQISTRTEDFIIDALELRSHIYRLNETFTDPAIVKVLHGAEMDIIWLQRDFGVYIVNLFDTYHASNVLEMPSHGLAYLLQYYCNVFADKKYQRADWRMRPLPQGMINYARSDTHYLLYVYDRMRNEVLAKSNETHNHMGVVLERSESTALNLYEKEVYDTETGEGPKGWKNALRKLAGALSAEQFAVFKALHAWRDHTARREDESTLYVLPNPMLQRLAESMPTDAAAVIGMCVPTPPLVRINSVEIGRLIERVRNEARK
ncbi:ribonuclease H-like domain-containing protein, partial [Cladochytrium replicatum]